MKAHRSIQFLLSGIALFAAAPVRAQGALAAHLPPVPRFEDRCANAGERGQNPQGPALWGLRPAGTGADLSTKPLLQRVDVKSTPSDRAAAATLRVQGGRLSTSQPAAAGTDPAVGAVLTGLAPDGTRVQLAICAARPSPKNPAIQLYNVQYRNKAKGVWQNICEGRVLDENGKDRPPLAMAVSGVWNPDGTREEVADAFTFACETGAIGKCGIWGYIPGEKSEGGRSLTEYHAACTRMARADYCGNGQPHTTPGVLIDLYDDLGIQRPERKPGSLFEGAWSPDGAYCLSRTRKGIPLSQILKECPERFTNTLTNLGDGDTCTVTAKGAARPLLRNGFRSEKK